MRTVYKRVLSIFLTVIMVCTVILPCTTKAEAAENSAVNAAIAEAEAYINVIIPSEANVKKTTSTWGTQFSWDNEKRESANKSYLFEWSYYNGVVFEGLDYIYQATGDTAFYNKTEAYLAAMINGSSWKNCTNNSSKQAAGYVNYHGLDCYKSASMLLRHGYTSMARALYADLQSAEKTYASSAVGGNFYHTWKSAPAYKVWLDGIYMAQPFMAEYASYVNDTAELSRIANRFAWIDNNMYDRSTGLYYHAANSATNHANAFWLRAIGWYAAAMADVIPYMRGSDQTAMINQLNKLINGMLPYQGSNGMWRNFVNNNSAAYETSGTALMAYAILKGVNNGWLDASYAAYGEQAFVGICNNYLNNNTLSNICFKGSPDGSNNTFYNNEGKGLGPFIMAYAQMLESAKKPAHEHNYTAVVTNPTCTAEGYTTYTCAECGDSYVDNHVNALGHTYNAVVTTEPTCAKTGVKTYTCAVCKDTYTETLARLTHNYKGVVTAPTCVNGGYTTYTCQLCGDHYTADTTKALGHDYTAVVTCEATCENAGIRTYTCSRCNDSYTEGIPATNHKYTVTTDAATCTEAGVANYECEYCHDSYAEEIPALGHDYKATVTAPTCTAEGYTTYTCKRCGDSYIGNIIPALGHDYKAVVVAPTCTAEGYTTYTCTHCGHSYTADKTPAQGHDYEANVIAPTCTASGYTHYTCKHCGYAYDGDYTAALGHNYIRTETATQYVYTCSHCGGSYTEPIVKVYSYNKVSILENGNKYLVLMKSNNKYYALTHSGTTIGAKAVTVSNSKVTSAVTDSMLWDYNGTLYYKSGNTMYSLKTTIVNSYSFWGWSWGGTPKLSIVAGTGSQVRFSNSRISIGGYYLYYSGGTVSVNSSSYTTVNAFKQS